MKKLILILVLSSMHLHGQEKIDRDVDVVGDYVSYSLVNAPNTAQNIINEYGQDIYNKHVALYSYDDNCWVSARAYSNNPDVIYQVHISRDEMVENENKEVFYSWKDSKAARNIFNMLKNQYYKHAKEVDEKIADEQKETEIITKASSQPLKR